MNFENKIKTNICNNWKNTDKQYWFAHGEQDKKHKKCLNGLECYNEKCIFIHPEKWNPYYNKRELCEGIQEYWPDVFYGR